MDLLLSCRESVSTPRLLAAMEVTVENCFIHAHQMRRKTCRKSTDCLGTWLLLLLAEEGPETNTCDLGDLEANSGNISLSVAGATKASNEHFVLQHYTQFDGTKPVLARGVTHVLLNEVKATITWHEGGDLLAVLDQLYPGTLTNGGVRLLGLNADLLDNDSLGVG